MEVVFSKNVQSKINVLFLYITEEIKMPLTAFRYTKKMETFARSLAKNPLGYKICKQQNWFSKNYRCAIFNKTWAFVYEVKTKQIIIRDLVLSKLLS